MPKSLSTSFTEDKNLIASDKAWLIALQIDVIDPNSGAYVETIYLVKNEENVTFQGQEYTAYSFDIDYTQEAGGQPSVTITAEDVTRAWQTYMQNYSGGVGFKVRILVISEVDLNAPADIVEHFEVVAATAEDYNVTWTLGTQNMLGRKFPNRRQLKNRCAWEFKSTECGYTGSDTTCDYSLRGANGCFNKNNWERYGGFPGIRGSDMRYAT